MTTHPLNNLRQLKSNFDHVFESHRRIRRDAKEETFHFGLMDLPISLQNVTETLMNISLNAQYNPFMQWITSEMSCATRHAKRMSAMARRIPIDMISIMRDAPFPIPPQLKNFYAMVIHADRLLEDDTSIPTTTIVTLPR